MHMRESSRQAGWTFGSGSAKAARRGKKRQDEPPGFRNREAAKQADIIMMLVPDEMGSDIFQSENWPIPDQREIRRVWTWIQYSFQIHQTARRKRVHDRAQRFRASGPFRVHPGPRCSVPVWRWSRDPSGDTHKVGLAYGAAIGGARAAILETSFKEEDRNRPFW